jgi:hypothetical protein
LKQIKRHLNPATVIACIALFVALSGAAVAARTASRNSVKTASIANGAVTTPKLRNGAVVNAKLRNGAVTGAKIAPGTIGSGQLANGSVRSGQLGGQVVTEAKIKNGAVTNNKLGAEAVATGKLSNEAVTAAKISADFYRQLVKNVTYVTETSPNDSEEEKSVTANCPAGKETIGGGARINAPAKSKVAVSASYPLVDSNNGRVGWIASGRETPEESEDWQVVAYAICAEL